MVTFYFYELIHFLDLMKNTLLFIYSANILGGLVTVQMKNYPASGVPFDLPRSQGNEKLSYPKESENVRPHSSNSIENTTLL